jgi:hypothetical protein
LSRWCRLQFEALFLIHDLFGLWLPRLGSKGNDALDRHATVEYFPEIVDPDVGREGEEVGFPICAGVTN